MIRHDKPAVVCLSSLLVLLAFSFTVPISGNGDADALLKFKSSLVNATVLTGWDSNDPPCTGKKGSDSKWKGVMCSAGVVYALRLENMSLAGTLDVQALGSMRSLRSVSFMRNRFEGPIPSGLGGLAFLVHLYLAHNRFSGEIDGGLFAGMKDLVKVHLEGNMFSGYIPESLGKLPKLTEVNLEDNLFTGKIPPFDQSNLVTVNVANNRLEGRIPFNLGLMNITFFLGNKGLCGPPLLRCRYTGPPLVTVFLLALTVLAVVVLITVFCSICILSRRQRKGGNEHDHAPQSHGLGTIYGPTEQQQQSEKSSQDSKVYRKLANEVVKRDSTATSSSVLSERGLPREEDHKGGGGGDQRKLHFVRNDQEKFTLQDMLRASAEVLGSGGFGSSYKAALTSGRAVVVKRFRFMSNIGREEFYDHMKKIGRLSHPNLLPLIAFHYRKDEKLFVTDYIPNGSLANLLHANRTPGQVVLDWPIRLKIARGVTRGLAYLYRTFPDLNLPHGHLKSSNVLLDHDFEPLLTDYALVPVVNKDQSHQFMVAYKSPEFTQQDRTSRKSDVWSLGILILEILTGKFPANYLRQGKGADDELAAWVESVARTEWNADVFDKEMHAGKEQEGQMLKLLKIGLRCCDWDVERRMELHEAVDRIEEVDHREAGGSQESFRSSYVTASDGDNRFSRAMTGEFSLA
ncbi:probable LRR receptor-like serine/threonine-protein kinase At4g31250 [Raphanus sativus]|uniref:Probable LRR receptor-like serine/threonine-protein kinase At4g31250 n=1 Tax=Raphanus sativus TaxID=3726 RepID=A0A6J0M638_RAPSA|nr:probable LRR receptor-like serine/threonine-protein kinase At4g31250 [Raphanus sativus]